VGTEKENKVKPSHGPVVAEYIKMTLLVHVDLE
jgi:hypothetical protein